MGSRGEEAAITESLFRQVNERIAESAEYAPVDDALFVCECDDLECTAAIHMPLDRYESVRTEGTRFVVKPGHVTPDIERVVEETRHYDVVEKDETAAAETAEELDPRS
jgi:hypothetical protein